MDSVSYPESCGLYGVPVSDWSGLEIDGGAGGAYTSPWNGKEAAKASYMKIKPLLFRKSGI